MHPAPLLVALALGVDVGWKPLPEGGLEYIIQIEPELLNSLRNGQTISSDVPLVLQNVRRYRIQVGDGPLPQEGPLETPLPGDEPEPAKPPQAAVKRPQPRANTADTEAPRFVSTVPAASKTADEVKKPAAEAPAATPTPASTADTPDPFAKDSDSKAALAAEDANDKAPTNSSEEIEGPLFAAEAVTPPDNAAETDKTSAADEQPTLDRGQTPAANKGAKHAGQPAQPTVVQKVASEIPSEDPPLRGGAEAGSDGSDSASESAAPREPDKPWVWLTLALMGLAGSATVNVYQGLLHLSMRSKYRGVVRKLHDAESQLVSQPAIDTDWPDEQAGVETVEADDDEYDDDR